MLHTSAPPYLWKARSRVQTYMLAISKLVPWMVHLKEWPECVVTVMMWQNSHSGHAGFGGGWWNADEPGDNRGTCCKWGLHHCQCAAKGDKVPAAV